MSRAQTYRQNAPLGKPGQIIKGIARGTQILFGGIIAILLGVTLGKAWHYTTGWHHLWGFSCVIASASTFTAMALCSNTIQSYCYFFADGFFLTMWAIVAGIFGRHDGAELDDDEGSLCVESDGDDGLGVHFCVVNLAFYEGEEVGQEWYAGLNRAI
ncbi:hypothetical protein EG328_002296 [Venturia inaequalis]|uniref:MARVEL domain-containing protein n=1 Tax=Venturia inaequalis TaxID=5025 RepID=A0A8H3V6I2_VENIN|nr:hypothetical protein EG328_002296 [Venturia inaequalis]KAE9981259.1 hypothetical protein EG327_006270 [Venturia inaequalis]